MKDLGCRVMTSEMHPTRSTRISPKGLQSPLEACPTHRDTGRIKAPFAATICSTPFLKPLLFEHRKGFIQPSAWKGNSANFAMTEFSQVRGGNLRRRGGECRGGGGLGQVFWYGGKDRR